jgi:threonine dehydratase
LTTSHTVKLHHIERARRVIGQRLFRTPLLGVAGLPKLVEGNVLLKAELFQRTGSFKPRGVLNKLATLTSEERARGLLAVSSGNHAQAVAACAADQGLDCLVVMTKGASDQKAAAATAYGAALDRTAETASEAIALAGELARSTGRVQIPAYDDRHVIAGQGTIGLELFEQAPDLNTVIVPVSGGGLVSGIAVALKSLRPRIRVVAVEAELAPTLALALEAGHPVEFESLSLADGLGAPSVGELCLELCKNLVDETVHVSDPEIVAGMGWLYSAAKLACEPAGAAAAAALLAGRVSVGAGERVVVIVSGGNIDPTTAARLLHHEPPA